MFQQAPETWPCQRIVAPYETRRARWRRRIRRRPPDWIECGLYIGHAGACLPHVAGWYLRAPIAHPLDLLGRMWRWRCPKGCVTYGVGTEGPVHNVMHGDGWVLHEVAMEWRFEPCGHEFRTICERPDGG